MHYVIAHVLRARGVTQSALASQYGVTPGSVSSRFADIRTTLTLRPGDPRYRT